jgi:4-amino-4-deoxy-L-arabinose transferase-like glycosyltransferase
MTSVPPIVLGTVLLSGVVVFAAALGRRLLRLLHVEIVDSLEHGIIAIGLGLGAMQALPFVLFTLGIGSPLIFRLTLTAVSIMLLTDVRAVLSTGWRRLPLRGTLQWWEYFLLSLFTLLLTSIFVRAVCPITDIDGLLYHLTIARRFLEESRFVHLVTITPSNWPLGVESLFSVLLSLHRDAPIAIIQFLLGGITIGVVYLYGKHSDGRLCAATAVSLLLVQWMFWWEMATGYIDLGPTAFAALTVYALARAGSTGSNSRPWELLAALFSGFAATTKLQGFWVIIVFVLLILINNGDEPLRQRARKAMRLGGIAVLIVLPWYLRTWVLTGNPVYPMLYSVFGGAEWTPDGWRRYAESYIITDAIATGLPLTPVVVYTTYALRMLGGGLAAFFIVRITRNHPHNIPFRFMALFTACILVGSATNMRFLLPALPPFAVGAAIILQRWRNHLATILCSVACMAALWISISKIEPSLPLALRGASGLLSREEFIRSDDKITDFDVAEYANQHLPKSSRILLCLQREHTALYTAQTFWANYRLQDSFHYDSTERLLSDLRRIGITHIVLTAGFTQWYGSHPVWKVRKEIELPALLALAQYLGTKLFESNGVSLYRLDLPPDNDDKRTH